MKIEKFSKIYIQFVSSVMLLCMGTIYAVPMKTMYVALYERSDKGRFTIVAAVKHKQFLNLYEYLLHNALHFDPRYAGSLSTSGNPRDEHKNLHITLASTDLGAKNEQACKKALQAIAGFFNAEVHVNFDATKLKLDPEKHVILPLKLDHGYNQLKQLQQAVVNVLEQQKATGVHAKNPNHVTIGFADKLPTQKYHKKIGSGRVTHARLYHWVGGGDQQWKRREEFYPIAEVKIYR